MQSFPVEASCCVLHTACRMIHAAPLMLHAASCMVHGPCCIMQRAKCPLPPNNLLTNNKYELNLFAPKLSLTLSARKCASDTLYMPRCCAVRELNESFYTSARSKGGTKGCIEPIKSRTESTRDLLQLLTTDSNDKHKSYCSLILTFDSW